MRVLVNLFLVVPYLAAILIAPGSLSNRCFADGFTVPTKAALPAMQIRRESGRHSGAVGVSKDTNSVHAGVGSFSSTKLRANDLELSEEEDSDSTVSLIRKVAFGSILVADTLWSYTLAPGHDGTVFPQSDIELITNVLDPSFMANPPAGYALYSLLAFNAFLFAPFCWGGILYKEKDNFATWPFILASFPMAGISIYPYFAVRKPSITEDEPTYANRLADSILGRGLILGLFLVTVGTFVLTPTTSLADEWNGFVDILTSSQYASTTVSDVLLLSVSIVDPLSFDAKRRGYLQPNASPVESAAKLAPFLFPVYGILAWILTRPSLLDKDEM